MTIRPKDRKLAELILFISERSEGDPCFGSEKLSRVLFYADFCAYLLFGNSVTGQEYQKFSTGPGPKRFVSTCKALVARNELAIRNSEPLQNQQDRAFALRSARLTDFTADEIALVTKLIQDNWERTGPQVRYQTHEITGWECARSAEVIPYEIGWVSNRPPTEEERRRCLQDSQLAADALSGKLDLISADA